MGQGLQWAALLFVGDVYAEAYDEERDRDIMRDDPDYR